MSDVQQITPDAAGVTRTPTGEIANQSPTSTPPTEKAAETIVRPQPTPATTPTTTPSTETKAKADGKETPASGKSLLNEKGAPEGAPEKYADYQAPDGFALDKDVVGEFNTLAKKNNLSQTAAQELVDFYIKQTKEAHEAPFNAWTETQEDWRSEINSDPELGGSKLQGVKASIGRLLDSLGDAKATDAFREAMDYTGAGNNPAVVRLLHRIALKLTEGGPVRGSGPSQDGMIRPGTDRLSAAQAIYPNLPSNRS